MVQICGAPVLLPFDLWICCSFQILLIVFFYFSMCCDTFQIEHNFRVWRTVVRCSSMHSVVWGCAARAVSRVLIQRNYLNCYISFQCKTALFLDLSVCIKIHFGCIPKAQWKPWRYRGETAPASISNFQEYPFDFVCNVARLVTISPCTLLNVGWWAMELDTDGMAGEGGRKKIIIGEVAKLGGEGTVLTEHCKLIARAR